MPSAAGAWAGESGYWLDSVDSAHPLPSYSSHPAPQDPRRGGTQLHGPACAGHGGGCSRGLFILHLVFLVWSMDAQEGLKAWEPVGGGGGQGGASGRGVAEVRNWAWVLPYCHFSIHIFPHLLTGG